MNGKHQLAQQIHGPGTGKVESGATSADILLAPRGSSFGPNSAEILH